MSAQIQRSWLVPHELTFKNPGRPRALVFGTGGGNDILSAAFVGHQLRDHGFQVDIGDIQNPFIPSNSAIRPIIKRPSVKLSVPERTPGFVGELKGPDYFGKYFSFSIRFGTSKLLQELNRLVLCNGYDAVYGVDIGGDILGEMGKDQKLLTPMMDFASLYLLKEIAHQVPSYLMVYALGVDGELEKDRIAEIIEESETNGLVKGGYTASPNDESVQFLSDLYQKAREIRIGNTTRQFLKSISPETPKDKDLVVAHKFTGEGDTRNGVAPFLKTIPHEFFGKMFLIDAEAFALRRSESTFPFRNCLEQYIKLKREREWATEIDGFALNSGMDWTSLSKGDAVMVMLCYSTRIDLQKRSDMIREGINGLKDGSYDLALVFSSDVEQIAQKGLLIYAARDFAVVSSNQTLNKTAQDAAEEISSFQ